MIDMDEAPVVMARWDAAADPASVDLLRERVLDFADAHGIAEAPRRDVGMAVSEAFANAVHHAYPGGSGAVTVDAATDGDLLSLRVCDHGTGVGEERLGLGVQLMRGLAERVEVSPSHDGTGTVVMMEFPMARRGLVTG